MARLIIATFLAICLLRVVLADSDPARITITTNGTVASVETSGGDVGYPGPSQVVIESDALGIVVVSRVRVFRNVNRVYVPWVGR